MNKKRISDLDPEIAAMSEVYTALKGLDAKMQARVLSFVARKLELPQGGTPPDNRDEGKEEPVDPAPSETSHTPTRTSGDDEFDGISPIAQKWIRRNSLCTDSLSLLFSLGVDEIDLVAKTIPGDSKKDRMRNVFLLKGVASYLSGGVARFSHDEVKEACLHYDAYDVANFAAHLKKFGADISGAKEGGYSLTARGLSSATDLIRTMLNVQGVGKKV